jgi:hypothetical protein
MLLYGIVGVETLVSKTRVSQVIGFIKGKSAIHLARVYGERKRNFVGQHSGQGILRLDGRAGRSRHQGVHPRSKSRRTCAWIR